MMLKNAAILFGLRPDNLLYREVKKGLPTRLRQAGVKICSQYILKVTHRPVGIKPGGQACKPYKLHSFPV